MKIWTTAFYSIIFYVNKPILFFSPRYCNTQKCWKRCGLLLWLALNLNMAAVVFAQVILNCMHVKVYTPQFTCQVFVTTTHGQTTCLLWCSETKIEPFGQNSKKVCFVQTHHFSSPQKCPTWSEAWWWQDHASFCFFLQLKLWWEWYTLQNSRRRVSIKLSKNKREKFFKKKSGKAY